MSLSVLITRPKHQAIALESMLRAIGADTFILPSIDILPPRDINALNHAIKSTSHYDIAIFVSANAVRAMAPHWPLLAQPSIIVAIGPGTKQAAELNDIMVDQMPEKFSTEGLLELPIFQQLADKKIVIFSGANSRDLLKNTLEKRGANVTTVECYRRACPGKINDDLLQELNDSTINWIISTSSESLKNLDVMLSHSKWLLEKNLVVISDKMRDQAFKIGFTGKIVVSSNADNASIVAALQNH